MKIFIADDHVVVRQGIKQLLQEQFGQAEFGEASNGNESVVKIKAEPWDVIIIDVSMPQKNGVDVLKQIRQENISTPVLVMSIHSQEQYAPTVLKAGADAYMEKRHISEELLGVIHKLLNK